METQYSYKSFNSEKSIEELQYNMLQYKMKLQNLEYELVFLKFLVNSNLYESKKMNLFEALTLFKKELDAINITRLQLLNEVNLHTSQIYNKIECEDLLCDNFFLNLHEKLEHKIYDFNIKTADFKVRIFQYIQSAIKN